MVMVLYVSQNRAHCCCNHCVYKTSLFNIFSLYYFFLVTLSKIVDGRKKKTKLAETDGQHVLRHYTSNISFVTIIVCVYNIQMYYICYEVASGIETIRGVYIPQIIMNELQ